MISNHQLRLRAVQQADLRQIHRWLNLPDGHEFWPRPFPPSREEVREYFEQVIEPALEARIYLVELPRGVPIGLVDLRQIDRISRHARLGVLVGELDVRGQGHGSAALSLAVQFAFDRMHLHRVYAGVGDYNQAALACYRRGGFSEEGLLRDHRFHLGRYWDEHLLARTALAPAPLLAGDANLTS